jgi:pimeloyl-ACP methyl ester carboxylesterase
MERTSFKQNIQVFDDIIALDSIELKATIAIPHYARGLILFAHGSGSNRQSPRNQFIAKALNQIDFATILVDLLGSHEKEVDTQYMDIPLFAKRIIQITKWAKQQPRLQSLPIGIIGSSTGGSIVLEAAATDKSQRIRAIILRSGRSDLVDPNTLACINVPVLFIVGELDREVQAFNQQSQAFLAADNQLVVIPNASHLFSESGTLEAATEAIITWFETHLV